MMLGWANGVALMPRCQGRTTRGSQCLNRAESCPYESHRANHPLWDVLEAGGADLLQLENALQAGGTQLLHILTTRVGHPIWTLPDDHPIWQMNQADLQQLQQVQQAAAPQEQVNQQQLHELNAAQQEAVQQLREQLEQQQAAAAAFQQQQNQQLQQQLEAAGLKLQQFLTEQFSMQQQQLQQQIDTNNQLVSQLAEHVVQRLTESQASSRAAGNATSMTNSTATSTTSTTEVASGSLGGFTAEGNPAATTTPHSCDASSSIPARSSASANNPAGVATLAAARPTARRLEFSPGNSQASTVESAAELEGTFTEEIAADGTQQLRGETASTGALSSPAAAAAAAVASSAAAAAAAMARLSAAVISKAVEQTLAAADAAAMSAAEMQGKVEVLSGREVQLMRDLQTVHHDNGVLWRRLSTIRRVLDEPADMALPSRALPTTPQQQPWEAHQQQQAYDDGLPLTTPVSTRIRHYERQQQAMAAAGVPTPSAVANSSPLQRSSPPP